MTRPALSWSGELARHARYVAAHAAEAQLAALAANDRRSYLRTLGQRNRQIVLEAIAGGATRIAEIKAALADVDLGASSVRNAIYVLIREGRLEKIGRHNSRGYRLKEPT